MSFKITGFSPKTLHIGPRTPTLISGKELNQQTLAVGFADEAGLVISGCSFKDDKDKVINIPKGIKVFEFIDDDTNDESISVDVRVLESITALKVKIFLKLDGYPIDKCTVD